MQRVQTFTGKRLHGANVTTQSVTRCSITAATCFERPAGSSEAHKYLTSVRCLPDLNRARGSGRATVLPSLSPRLALQRRGEVVHWEKRVRGGASEGHRPPCASVWLSQASPPQPLKLRLLLHRYPRDTAHQQGLGTSTMAETEGLKQRADVETEEPAPEPEKKKKKKKKKTQDHEVCAGTGTLDQIFIVFLFMTIVLLGAMYYLFSVRHRLPARSRPASKFEHTHADALLGACNAATRLTF